MSCEQCLGLERVFDDRAARADLRRYRRRGPQRTTKIMVDVLIAEGIVAATVLDIGGGVGAIPNAMIRAGARSARLVDASAAYLATARDEAERQGHLERMSFRFGDFVGVAAEEPAAEVVTLDRVICCYDDMEALVSASTARAERLYGLVYPRDSWWNRLVEPGRREGSQPRVEARARHLPGVHTPSGEGRTADRGAGFAARVPP
ncbi:MAG: methyltransferase domain-containing protein [Trueperaceae bacterium]